MGEISIKSLCFFSYTSVALRLASLFRAPNRYLAYFLCDILVESGFKWMGSFATSPGSRTANSEEISYPRLSLQSRTANSEAISYPRLSLQSRTSHTNMVWKTI